MLDVTGEYAYAIGHDIKQEAVFIKRGDGRMHDVK